MRIFFQRLGSTIVAAGGWVLLGIRVALDLIGWSTAPEDVGVAMTRVDQILDGILSLPWYVPWGFALISTMWLMWVSWPRPQASVANEAPLDTGKDRESFVEPAATDAPIKTAPTERDDLALEELTNFALDHVEPAIRALAELQKAMLRKYQGHEIVGHFAMRGIYNRDGAVIKMYAAYEKISALGGSPQPHYSLDDMECIIFDIEETYQYFVLQLHRIASSIKINFKKEHEFSKEWTDWREKHDAMSAAYDGIRRSRKFRKLYRPGLPNRFNEGVE